MKIYAVIIKINILLIFFFGSCKAQLNQRDNSYKVANLMITNYGKSADKVFLEKALNYL